MSSETITKGRPAGIVNAAVTTAQIFPDQSNALIPSMILVPGGGRLEQRRFRVRASGYATSAGAATTFQPSIYSGNSLAVANDVVLAAATATVINTTTAPWWLEMLLIFDSISGKLQGQYSAFINGSIVAAAVITNPLTGLNGTAAGSEPVFSLVCGVTFSAGAAGNAAGLAEFTLDY